MDHPAPQTGPSRYQQPDRHARQSGTSITVALADAAKRGYDEKDCIVTAFWQAFGSTAGPFGGVGGQMVTGFPMVVILDRGEEGPRASVYCSGRLLYEVSFRQSEKLSFTEADGLFARFATDVASGSVDARGGRYRPTPGAAQGAQDRR